MPKTLCDLGIEAAVKQLAAEAQLRRSWQGKQQRRGIAAFVNIG